MLDKSIKYFHEGKFDKVKRIIEKLEHDRQGDVEAMKMLISGLCVDDIEQARKIYTVCGMPKNSAFLTTR